MKKEGAKRLAYPTVAASGSNAYFTHWGRNDSLLKSGDLLLMDAGCELHGYSSDVTRTWPISGKFSSAQLAVYNAVLAAHRSLLMECREGSSIRELHQSSVNLLSQSIKDLGLKGNYTNFYWHSVSHWLGLDVHDSSSISHSRPLQAGHVITIEPGIYIPDEPEYGSLRGIGVRIEDDVLILPSAEGRGCEVLSGDLPISAEDIEDLKIE